MRGALHAGLIGLQAVACIALIARGLWRQHLAVVGLLFTSAVMNVALWRLDPKSAEYLQVWALCLPAMSAWSVAMGWQAYGRSLETSPRAQRLSHQLLLGSCVVAAVGAQFAQNTLTYYGVLSRIDHGVSAALGLFCLVMMPLLHHFYSPRRRPNAVTQEWIITIYYLGNALMLLATHWQLFPFNTYLSMTTSALCCLAWIFCLTRAGEDLPPPASVQPGDRVDKLDAEAYFDAVAKRVKSATRSK